MRMKAFFPTLLFLFLVMGTKAQLTPTQIHALKGGRVNPDRSFVYALPYQPGKKFMLIQGWQSSYSHKGEIALDFKMKKGSSVHAARDGVVESVMEDSDKGGLSPEYLALGNHISIRHSDGSVAHYWHLQKDGALVKEGDTVKIGQAIGLSGNTGYTAFPHLHFEVVGADENGQYRQVPIRFQTRKGIKYLRPGRWYKAVPAASSSH